MSGRLSCLLERVMWQSSEGSSVEDGAVLENK
jgi:hypothetical protein